MFVANLFVKITKIKSLLYIHIYDSGGKVNKQAGREAETQSR